LAALVVLTLLGVAFVAGTAGVALLSKYMPAAVRLGRSRRRLMLGAGGFWAHG
jgi:hypothetical protein